MLADNTEYEKLLKSQLSMTIKTWEQLQANGATEKSKLKLEFFFYCSSETSAKDCMQHFLEYEYKVEIKPENDNEKTSLWLLSGNTQPTEVNEKILLQWVDYMVTAGWNYGCYFDGWGAEIP
ncbi:hypothetical protein LA52FAK_06540 [Desulforhopalus sp. 52FAK]